MSKLETLFVMRNGIKTLINKSDLRESDQIGKPKSEEKPVKKESKSKK